MKKNLFSACVLFFCFSMMTSAQERLIGTRYNIKTEKSDEVFFYSSNFSREDVFFNKYFVFANKASKDTLYYIEINFKKGIGSIEVRQIKKGVILSSTDFKFNPISTGKDTSNAKPFYCFKNDRFNDTTLTLTDKNLEVFFTIVDTSQYLIFLHQYLTHDGEYILNLDKFRNAYLTPHLIHSKIYWGWYFKNKADSIRSVQLYSTVALTEIEKEKQIIKNEWDSVIAYFNKTLLKFKSLKPDANTISQARFNQQMDSIFINKLSKTYPFDIDISGKYKICATDSSNQIMEQSIQQTSDSLFLTYFYRRFKSIDTSIYRLKLQKEVALLSVNDSLNAIFDRHRERKQLNPVMKNFSESYDSVTFKPLFDSIIKDLNKYTKKNSIPTIYSYQFNYSSKTQWQKWILNGKMITNADDEIVINDTVFNASFHNKIPNAKNGKYNVRLNTSTNNSDKIGPEVYTVYRKYKFMTHFGINVGTFIIGKDLAEEAKSNLYYNLLFIRHHMGLFLGYSSSAGFQTNYYEGGMYIAPGNYFYFKVGAASYNNKFNALVGGSLIVPFFQIEGGYNFVMKMPYVMVGLNFPLNK
jgi:chorismate mutase